MLSSRGAICGGKIRRRLPHDTRKKTSLRSKRSRRPRGKRRTLNVFFRGNAKARPLDRSFVSNISEEN